MQSLDSKPNGQEVDTKASSASCSKQNVKSLKPKLLAPAGNIDSLIAAVTNGADAVYFGLNKFNARLKADNFNTQNLAQWVDYCHLFGVEVFVTINTNLKNEEIMDACNLAVVCYNSNVDGLIVTDLGLVNFLSKYLPDFKITLSTQQSIHNTLGASVAKSIGCNTVVLARETSLIDLQKISKDVDIDIEYFLHGALCSGISGQCYFSSMIDGNSGNRGLCAQPCRQKYTAVDKNDKVLNEGYLLSTKDMCNIRNLKKLADSKVQLLKIEGRNRRPQYVAQTVKTYKKVIDNNYQVTDSDIADLKTIYNRGDYTEGYLFDNKQIVYPFLQGHKVLKIGNIVNVNNEFYAKSKIDIKQGDAFKVLHNGKEVDNGIVLTSSKNGLAKISLSSSSLSTCFVKNTNGTKSKYNANAKIANQKITDRVNKAMVGDEVYLTTSVSQIAQLDSQKRTLNVRLILSAYSNQIPTLTAICGDVTVEVSGDTVVQKAQKNPTSQQEIYKQLSKTGNTYYTITDIVSYFDDIFMPVAELNALRRLALQALTQKITSNYTQKLNRLQKNEVELSVAFLQEINKKQIISKEESLNLQEFKTSNVQVSKISYDKNDILLYCMDTNQKIEVDKSTILVYKPTDYTILNAKSFCESNINAQKYLDLPNFATEADLVVLDNMLASTNFDGIVANNLYALLLASKYNKKIIIGTGLNIFNDAALSLLKAICGQNYFGFVYSKEITFKEISSFRDKTGYIFVYGMICLMTLAHCPVMLNKKCDCSCCKYDGDIYYVDNANRHFALKRKRISRCYWELYNCYPLSVADKYLMSFNKFVLAPDTQSTKATYGHFLSLSIDKSLLPQNDAQDAIDANDATSQHTTGRLIKKVN